jgi:zinc transporter 2
MVIEIVCGYMANSIAIMSDAAHLFSDVLGIGFSAVALIIAQRKANHKYSWGYHRAEVFGALLSIFSIWIITAFLAWEAIERLQKKPQVLGKLMFGTAILCLLFNLIQIKILHSDDELGLLHSSPLHGECSHDHGHGHGHAHHHKDKSKH